MPVLPLVHQILVATTHSAGAFFRSGRVIGTAFPSVFWRRTEPPGAGVLALL
jgi:hypothetical protein